MQSDPVHATGRVLAKETAGNEMAYEIMFPVAWDFIEVNSNAAARVKASE